MLSEPFALIFYICLFGALVVTINIIHWPSEIEHPENPDINRIPIDKETKMQQCQFYLRELCAPEHALKRRQALLFALICTATLALSLHFVQDAEYTVQRYNYTQAYSIHETAATNSSTFWAF